MSVPPSPLLGVPDDPSRVGVFQDPNLVDPDRVLDVLASLETPVPVVVQQHSDVARLAAELGIPTTVVPLDQRYGNPYLIQAIQFVILARPARVYLLTPGYLSATSRAVYSCARDFGTALEVLS